MIHWDLTSKGCLCYFICMILATATLISFFAISNVNADWTQLSHDESHQAFTSEIVEEHELKWIIELRKANQSDIITSPIIYKGHVIMATYQSLFVLDLETGKELWNFSSEHTVFDTPAVAEDIIVVPTWGGNTYGISIEGELLWERSIFSSVPTIHEGRVYLSGFSAIHCVNIHDGKDIWKYEIEGPGTPAIWNEKVIFGTNKNGTLYAIHKDNRALLWSYPIPEDDGIWGVPVVADERVFFSTFRWVDHETIAGRLTALDTDGSFLWDYHLDDSTPGAPSVAYETVFFGTVDWTDNKRDDLQVVALNSIDGSVVWTLEGYRTEATLAISDGKVYFPVVQSDDRFVLFVAHANTGNKFWEYDCENNPGTISIFSSPAIADGTLVVGGIGSEVIAIGSNPGNGNNSNDEGWTFFEKGFTLFIVMFLSTAVLYYVTTKAFEKKK